MGLYTKPVIEFGGQLHPANGRTILDLFREKYKAPGGAQKAYKDSLVNNDYGPNSKQILRDMQDLHAYYGRPTNLSGGTAFQEYQDAIHGAPTKLSGAGGVLADTISSVGKLPGFLESMRPENMGGPLGDATLSAVGTPVEHFAQNIRDTLEGSTSFLHDVNDPAHPIGAQASLTAEQSDIDAINQNNKFLAAANKPAPAISGQETTNTPSPISKDISKGEANVERKIRGRAATLLTGPSGLMDVPFTARRKLLGA
ncbi:hypothetical protein [Caudoviricetes sp.]|nr:hypothetical protein [Caudoviricetes sp.]